MSVEVMYGSKGPASNGDAETGRDAETLYLLGGIALVVFGAGLVLTNPTVRRLIGQIGVGNLAQNVIPDVQRYFRLREM